MIDTHAHLSIPLTPFNKGELKINGLEWVVLSGSNLEDSKANVELAKSNPKLLAAVGIHPQEQLTDISYELSVLDELLKNNKKIVAVGECGLDFSGEHSREHQEKLFRGQIELAIKYDKPLIVHSRKASDETIAILNEYKCRGVIHCYTGGIKRISKVPENFCFGIDGNLTYEDGLVEVVRNIPKDRLVLETDSPFLTPIPHRGETNYPEYVKFVYAKVAEIWGMSFEETEKIVDGNAKRLFSSKPFVS